MKTVSGDWKAIFKQAGVKPKDLQDARFVELIQSIMQQAGMVQPAAPMPMIGQPAMQRLPSAQQLQKRKGMYTYCYDTHRKINIMMYSSSASSTTKSARHESRVETCCSCSTKCTCTATAITSEAVRTCSYRSSKERRSCSTTAATTWTRTYASSCNDCNKT